jgi:undecaprenyl-diphosphatase
MNVGIGIILFLAVVQGFTEFFPVSSSGHLVIFESLFGMRGDGSTRGIVFEVAVHVGTLGAVVVFYRQRIMLLCRAFFSLLFSGRTGCTTYRKELSYIGLIIVGTIPAAVIGGAFHDQVKTAFNAPSLTALCLVATGIYLLTGRLRAASWNLTWYSALIIGLAQAIAILPGCSRSGWTITTGLLLGLGFVQAAEFSFLLSIPAILGATVLELMKEPAALTSHSPMPLLIGAGAAFISGLLALKLLIGILRREAFHRFAYYLLPVGLAAYIYFALLP